MIAKSELELELFNKINRLLEPEKFQVVDLDISSAKLTVFIEGLPPKTGASIDDCARMSQIVGTALEEWDHFDKAYELEVSSPGMERRLVREADFQKSVGFDLKLKFTERVEGIGGKCTARLLEVTSGPSLILHKEGNDFRVPLNKIRRANLVWDFNRKCPSGGESSQSH